MKNIIPAITETICDICDRKESFKCEAVLKISRNGLDWANAPVANASSAYDLCDSCVIEIESMIMKLKRERWRK
jgi:hypothetical protein